VRIGSGALWCLPAVYGYGGMYLVSLISTPLIIVLAIWVITRSLEEVGGLSGLAGIQPSASMTAAAAITIVVGTFASAGTQAPNWTRFGKTGAQAIWACIKIGRASCRERARS